MKPFPLAPARPQGLVGVGPEYFAALQDGFTKTTARFQSETDMPLKLATEMKALADQLDLSPILDDIAKTIETVAAAGDYSCDVSIKDSLYSKKLAQISSAIAAKGYFVTAKDFDLHISWVDAK